jgi:DNA-binding PadR family transcriptional regulator
MRPLRVLSLQKDNGMDFVTDCVLDLLSDFPKATATQTIVDECNKDKVSSPATTHKKLNMLKKLGLVEVLAHPDDKDGRKCYIKVSAKGMDYLTKWEGIKNSG